jgi:hypothetical protein
MLMVLFVLVKAVNEIDQAVKSSILQQIYADKLKSFGNACLIDPNVKNNFFVFFEMEVGSEERKQDVLDCISGGGIEIYESFCLSRDTRGVFYSAMVRQEADEEAMIRYCFENLPSARDFLFFMVDCYGEGGGLRFLNIYIADKLDPRRDAFRRDFQRFTIEHHINSVERNSW